MADKLAEAQRIAAAAASAQKDNDAARARMQELLNAADEQTRDLRTKLAALADRMKSMVDKSELDLLRQQMAGMVKKHELDAALAREQSLKDELDALKAKLRGMVPAGDRDASVAETRKAQVSCDVHRRDVRFGELTSGAGLPGGPSKGSGGVGEASSAAQAEGWAFGVGVFCFAVWEPVCVPRDHV